MKQVKVLNMTKLFNKELLIYSFFDLKLKQPLKLIRVFYFFVCVLGFSPILLIAMNGTTLGIVFAGAFILSNLMSKPIWGGKSFFDFLITQIKYIASPKYYYDNTEGHKMNQYTCSQQIVVSRHADYNLLYKDKKESLERSLNEK